MQTIKMILFLIVFFPLASEGFIRTRTSLGTPIEWKSKSKIDLFFNPANNDGLRDSEIETVFKSSITTWNNYSSLKISGNVTSNSIQQNINTVIFTTSPIFSTGVLAVTAVSYEGRTGEILKADIMINDKTKFTTNKGDTKVTNLSTGVYLGDVLTHELGHLLGLGHGQVHRSTMLYSAFNGQYSLKEDDQVGVSTLYPISSSDKGILSGRIIGSKNLVGILGTQVQVISSNKGIVISSVFTDENGNFTFYQLPFGDTYYLYVNPMNTTASVPPYFLSAQKNFCLSSSNYRGSFFSKCGADEEGFPQGFYLSSDWPSIHVGDVSIKCNLESPPEYMDKKLYGVLQNDEYSLNFVQSNGSYGNAFVGSFSEQEISDGTYDSVKIDLSGYPTTQSKYLDVKLISQALWSPLRAVVNVYRNGQFVASYPNATGTMIFDNDQNPDLDLNFQVPLSAQPQENVFLLTIKPLSMFSNNSFQLEDFFPAASNFLDPLSFYFLVTGLSQKESNGQFTMISRRNYKSYQDNKTCPSGPNSYKLLAFTSNLDVYDAPQLPGQRKKNKSSLFNLNCGSIDIDKDNPDPPQDSSQGPLHVALSFLGGFLISAALMKFFHLSRMNKLKEPL